MASDNDFAEFLDRLFDRGKVAAEVVVAIVDIHKTLADVDTAPLRAAGLHEAAQAISTARKRARDLLIKKAKP